MSAQVTILQLSAAGAITGTEAVPIVQNGVTVQTTVAAIAASPSQPYTYLTVTQTPQLANSRYVGATNGLSIADGGAQGLFNITTTGALLSLVNSGTGFQVKTSSTAITSRSIAVSGVGLSIANGSGVSGDPTITLAGQVLNLANLSANGLMVITSAGALSATFLLNVADQTAVFNAGGTTGNPTIGLASNPIIPGTGSILVPVGTTGQRGSGVSGKIRFNSTDDAYEGYAAGQWRQFSLSGGVTLINTGTGLTGGPITGTGTISLANTAVTAASYGSSTQVGTFTVNAQGQLTAAANVTITPAAIGAVSSVSGTANEITATGTTTVVLSLPAALNFTGKTVTGGTFSLPIISAISNSGTITVPSGTDTLVARNTTDTLTNKSISGTGNTLSNIGNASLVNSAVTINGNAVSLGGSTTVTAATPNALTISTGLSGTSFNGSTPVTIALANTAVTAGAYGSTTQVGTFTVNAQGQLTLAGNTTVTPAVGSITGLGSGVATALAVNVGSAGAPVVNGGALGTPTSGTLTNATNLPLTTGVTGTLPIANGGTNSTASPTVGGVTYGTGTAYAFTAAGTAGQILTSTGSGAPAFAGISGGIF